MGRSLLESVDFPRRPAHILLPAAKRSPSLAGTSAAVGPDGRGLAAHSF